MYGLACIFCMVNRSDRFIEYVDVTRLMPAVDSQYSLANPSMEMVQEITQPRMFVGALKPYQLRGVNWLVNLYQQVCSFFHDTSNDILHSCCFKSYAL